MSDEHGAAGGYGGGGADRAPDRLAWSIVVTVLCCMPFGIPAIVYSAKAMSANSAGNFAEAWDASRKAKTWITVAAVTGGVIALAYFGLMMLGVIAGAAGAAGGGVTP